MVETVIVNLFKEYNKITMKDEYLVQIFIDGKEYQFRKYLD